MEKQLKSWAWVALLLFIFFPPGFFILLFAGIVFFAKSFTKEDGVLSFKPNALTEKVLQKARLESIIQRVNQGVAEYNAQNNPENKKDTTPIAVSLQRSAQPKRNPENTNAPARNKPVPAPKQAAYRPAASKYYQPAKHHTNRPVFSQSQIVTRPAAGGGIYALLLLVFAALAAAIAYSMGYMG